ncbi:MAG: DUF5683 domain-containing protein [Bacteroidales bacterium]|nr:DUF5683 domain-containing protein [Bacteroidales bacterium]
MKKLSLKTVCVLTIGCLIAVSVHAQNGDSLNIKKHSPRTASLLSTVVPGAGQIYNRKYWKLPVVYGGLGILTYFVIQNNNLYKDYKEAYLIRNDGNPETVDNYTAYSSEGLLQAQNYYRRNMELSVIFTVALYALNIVDAAVDAHLYYFDINDDLSLELNPLLLNPLDYNDKKISGFKLTLNF